MRNVAIRSGIVGLGAVLALAVWVLLIRDSGDPVVGPSTARLYVADQDAIAAVSIRTGEATVRFERHEGAWHIRDADGVMVNTDRWGGVALLLTGPRIERELGQLDRLGAVREGLLPVSEYGLDSPSTIDVELDDGSTIGVTLGDRTPDDRHHYAMVGGGDDVFLVNADWGTVLMGLATQPPYPYWYYAVDPKLIRVFEVDARDDAVTIFLGIDPTRPEGGRVLVGGAVRNMTEPELAEAMALVGGPGTMKLLGPGSAADPALGFATPTMTLRLTYALAQPIDERVDFSTVYVVGGKTPDGTGYYAATSDTPSVLQFEAAWVEAVLALRGSIR